MAPFDSEIPAQRAPAVIDVRITPDVGTISSSRASQSRHNYKVGSWHGVCWEHVRSVSILGRTGGCGEGRASVSLGRAPYRAARFDMTSKPQAIVSGKNVAARSPEVDFAVVLSRIIESIEHDSAQLRAVYELARIKLRREAWRKTPPISRLEARRLTLALESAIEGVETIYSKHDEFRALQSLDRFIESSEIGRRIEPPEPLLMIDPPPTQTADADHRAKGPSLNVERSLHWLRAAPLLRGAVVAILAVALCAALSQFDLLGRHAPLSSPSQSESPPMFRPSIAPIDGAPAGLRHRRFVAAGSQSDTPRYNSDDRSTVALDEQPVKPLRSSCTQTYEVPSEGGGKVSINVVRC
jgi:hypothetical protein